MLTKILFTGLVFAVVFGLTRFRNRARAEIPLVRVAPREQPVRPLPRYLRPLAYGLATLMLVSSVLWYYTAWREDQTVVTIRVINTGSGDVATYRAHKGNIDGRSFETLEGLRVRIADAERVEVFEE